MQASVLIIGQRPAFSEFDVARAAVSVYWTGYVWPTAERGVADLLCSANGDFLVARVRPLFNRVAVGGL